MERSKSFNPKELPTIVRTVIRRSREIPELIRTGIEQHPEGSHWQRLLIRAFLPPATIINPGNLLEAVRMVQDKKEDEGNILLTYPEGGRSYSGRLKRPHSRISALVPRKGTEILPFAQTEEAVKVEYPRFKPVVRGVLIESPDINRTVAAVFLDMMRMLSKVKTIRTEGKLPKTGPVLVVPNHDNYSQPLMVTHAIAVASGRSSNSVMKDTLLNPALKDDPKVLERLGEQSKMRGPLGTVFASARALILKGGDPLPITRGKKIDSQFERIHRNLDEGRVTVFYRNESTRNPDVTSPGVALVAIKNPDVPIFPTHVKGSFGLGKFNEPITVKFGKSFTYSDIPEGPGRGRRFIQRLDQAIEELKSKNS